MTQRRDLANRSALSDRFAAHRLIFHFYCYFQAVYNFHSGNASCTSEEVMSIDQAAAQPPDPPEEGVIPQPGPVTVYVMLAVRSLT